MWYAYSDEELEAILKEVGRDQNNKIQRYKGLELVVVYLTAAGAYGQSLK